MARLVSSSNQGSWGWLGEAKVSCILRLALSYVILRDWTTAGQGLLSLQQVRVEGECFISSVSSLKFNFLFFTFLSFISTISLFSLSLGYNTK